MAHVEPHKETSEVLEQILKLNIAENVAEITTLLKNLRLLLTQSPESQRTLAKNAEFARFVRDVVFNPIMRTEQRTLHILTLQVLANSVVNNEESQTAIWQAHGHQIAEQAAIAPLGSSNNVLLMIMYNIYMGARLPGDQLVFETCVKLWQAIIETQTDYNFEYLHFLMEQFIVKDGRSCVQCYQRLKSVEERITFLDYVAHYLREDSPNGEINNILLQFFAKEFRLKSDCILRETIKLRHQLHPREVHTLLRIIASASGSEKYAKTYAADQSLFINVSSLLRCVIAAGKEPDSCLDKPMTKLEEVALSSNIDADYEARVSFELKTLLVRCTANLLYENVANRGYCLDTQLLPALLECTVMDARNPLMREWSILAIRNACFKCPEAQQVIAQLTLQGAAPNDLLSELNLDLGALRITDRKQ
ncbi:PREDICTED: ataxin-10 isoform X1 [Drosophila arizonae]|uniref:Ataxin-10 n=1 Tax=Drosophila arizonae TaxID=7263 RepID=A0ABM1PI07_DROAR|nr:PREDICTED: ataxin-10 isoform X1 [Drosophila arizonae]